MSLDGYIWIEYNLDFKASEHTVSDVWIDNEYEQLINATELKTNHPRKVFFRYSTELVFYRVLLGVLLGDIKNEDVIFEFKRQQFRPLDEWPDGFCDTYWNLFNRIELARLSVSR